MTGPINPFYRGNMNLKRANTPVEINVDKAVEIAKCKEDPIYFAENYIKVITLDDGFVNIDLYDYQKEIINSFNDYRRTIVCTSRQSGKTTTAVCIILHYILFNKDVKVAILANKADSAREVLERIQLAYEALPDWLQQGVMEFNKSKIILENKSQVLAAATSSSSIRGKTVNFIYIDETAFVENWDTFYASTYPTISSGKNTKILFTSTPYGLNHFYKFWEESQHDQESHEWNGFNPIKVMWYEVPGRDENWKRDTLAALSFDTQKFEQEYCCEFLGSSGTLISGAKLGTLVSRIPIAKNNDGLTQYEKPVKGNTYVLIADVSRGKGLDYSAFQVIDVTTVPYKQICVFKSNLILASDYAEIIYRTASAYNTAYVLVENNDIGAQIPEILLNDYEYENILYTENKGRAGKQISFSSKNSEGGIRTSTAVKSIGCSMLKSLVEQDTLLINDFETINELSTFSRKANSYQAEPGKHDDLVMPLVLFGWLSIQSFFKDLTDYDVMKALREKTQEEIEENMLPFGIIDDGHDTYFDPYESLDNFF